MYQFAGAAITKDPKLASTGIYSLSSGGQEYKTMVLAGWILRNCERPLVPGFYPVPGDSLAVLGVV